MAELEEAHLAWLERYVTEHAEPTDYAAFARCVPDGLARVDWLIERGRAEDASRVFYPLYRHLERRGEHAELLASGPPRAGKPARGKC